ncbi:hypothetical protein NJB1907E78_07380 [Mycobacterium marinum]|nr:hypothetical protein NJB1907E78_07380 [Mycobacterium marinum]
MDKLQQSGPSRHSGAGSNRQTFAEVLDVFRIRSARNYGGGDLGIGDHWVKPQGAGVVDQPARELGN